MRLREAALIGVLSPLGVLAGVVVANAVPERALKLAFAALALVLRGPAHPPRPAGAGRGGALAVTDHLRVNSRLAIPLSEVDLRASRSSGPGGQHANVTASRIEAVFDVEASASLSSAQRARLRQRHGRQVLAVAQDARSQARNRQLALERLRAKLREALATPKPRRKTRPTRAARERRREQKRRTSARKHERRRPDPGDY